MSELWKPIEGYSRYRVSNTGRVWDTKRDVEVSQMLTGVPQYKYVNMVPDEGKRKLVRVHRLVAIAFVGGRSKDFDIVDHIDRDKLNNNSTNLRWVDRRGNSVNRDCSVFVEEGLLLTDWVLELASDEEEYQRMYNFLYSRLSKGESKEEAYEGYRQYIEYGYYRREVLWRGETAMLLDLCKSQEHYDKVVARLARGWDIEDAIFNRPPISHYTNGIILPLDRLGVVNIYYHNKKQLAKSLGLTKHSLRDRLDKYSTVDEILNYDPSEKFRFWCEGFYGTREEICKQLGISLSAVETKMIRKGLSFEEAVKLPRERIKRVVVNGVSMTPKELWETYNIPPKKANEHRVRHNISFEETLDHFGVDVTDIEITY